MAAANLGELPDWARELLDRSPLGHLSYLDDRDRPRVLPVTYAVAEGSIWSAIDKKPKDRPPEKIARVRAMIGSRAIHLEVDGGVAPDTAGACAKAGADVLVAGSAVFKGGRYADNIAAIRAAASGSRS